MRPVILSQGEFGGQRKVIFSGLPTARLAIWPGRQYTNLLFIPQASYIVIGAPVTHLREQRVCSREAGPKVV